MKKLKKNQLEDGEHYLVDTGYGWSPAGFDIARFNDGRLFSIANEIDLFDEDSVNEIYELPISKDE